MSVVASDRYASYRSMAEDKAIKFVLLESNRSHHRFVCFDLSIARFPDSMGVAVASFD